MGWRKARLCFTVRSTNPIAWLLQLNHHLLPWITVPRPYLLPDYWEERKVIQESIYPTAGGVLVSTILTPVSWMQVRSSLILWIVSELILFSLNGKGKKYGVHVSRGSLRKPNQLVDFNRLEGHYMYSNKGLLMKLSPLISYFEWNILRILARRPDCYGFYLISFVLWKWGIIFAWTSS